MRDLYLKFGAYFIVILMLGSTVSAASSQFWISYKDASAIYTQPYQPNQPNQPNQPIKSSSLVSITGAQATSGPGTNSVQSSIGKFSSQFDFAWNVAMYLIQQLTIAVQAEDRKSVV